MKGLSARACLLLGNIALVARKVWFAIFIISFVLSVVRVVPSFAQGTQIGTFVPPSGWQPDYEVTVVGKGAERARQFLWWVFKNPGISSAPIIAEYWTITRNIVYGLILLVIVGFGLSYILLRRRASMATVMPIFMKVAFVVLFATFSYIIILGLIQIAEVLMRFFIEVVGGRDLFNVIFAGAGSGTDKFEPNYTNFQGYRNWSADAGMQSEEMVRTSLFLIRFTSFTYYVLSVLMILRQIILWFLLIISPFLAVLLPFVFIRNTGFIWIGVFFQWLFYGPMVAMFLGALTKIWVRGIPFPFDFRRVNTAPGQIYKTAINILYGGPAQLLSPGNSANYVDTFAEYVIALIMLWTAIVLPWLLLRIFRDYCCLAIANGNALLAGIYDRMRQFPTPTSTLPTGSTQSTGMAVDLPFRSKIEEKIQDVTHTKIETVNKITQTNTSEIVRAMDMSVTKLSDISRMELNQTRRSDVEQRLSMLSAPDRIMSSSDRQVYSALRTELKTRAARGDREAARLITVSDRKGGQLAQEFVTVGRSRVSADRSVSSRAQAASLPTTSAAVKSVTQTVASDTQLTSKVSQSTSVPPATVQSVLRAVASQGDTTQKTLVSVSQQFNITVNQVSDILSHSQTLVSQAPAVSSASIATRSGVSNETVEKVLSMISVHDVLSTDTVENVASKSGISAATVEKIYESAQPPRLTMVTPTSVSDISNRMDMSQTRVEQVLNALSSSSSVNETTISEISNSIGITNEQVSQIQQLSTSTVVKNAYAPSVTEISSSVGVPVSTVEKVISALPQNASVTEAAISEIAKQTDTSKEKVKEIYEKIVPLILNLSQPADPGVIAKRVGVEEQKVSRIIGLIPSDKPFTHSLEESIAKDTTVSLEKVKEIYRETMISSGQLLPNIATEIAKTTHVPLESVRTILAAIPFGCVPSKEQISQLCADTNVDEDNVHSVVNALELSTKHIRRKPASVIAKDTGESESIVRKILSLLPVAGFPAPSKIADIAKQAGVSVERVKKVITSSKTQEATAGGMAPTVSLEDYEEVKNMWLNHYRSAPIPRSEKISDRTGWVREEQTRLTNVSTMLASTDPLIKQKGLEKVSEILPFLLLGGFTDMEILTYLKAKLEATKQIQKELEMEEKVRKEVEKKMKDEDENTMVNVKKGKEDEKDDAKTLEAALSVNSKDSTTSTTTQVKKPKGN